MHTQMHMDVCKKASMTRLVAQDVEEITRCCDDWLLLHWCLCLQAYTVNAVPAALSVIPLGIRLRSTDEHALIRG